jgi:hypothetical protein
MLNAAVVTRARGGSTLNIKRATMLLAVALPTACSQNMPVAYTGSPADPNSVTTFTLSLTPDSLLNCWQVNPGMDRPMTMTVQNNSGELLTAGGIHYSLTRVGPNVYAGGNYIKIRADLSTSPKTLMVRTNDQRCTWTASAA